MTVSLDRKIDPQNRRVVFLVSLRYFSLVGKLILIREN